MNKVLAFILLCFFINGSFVAVFSSVFGSSELVADSWTTKAPMNYPRFGLGVVAVDGKIYAIGGDISAGYHAVGANECYDPVYDTWVALKSMSTPRYDFAIAAYQGKIYCIGGYSHDANNNLDKWVVNEMYDTVSDSWRTKTSSPVIGVQNAQVIDGNIFVLSGQDLFMYDPVKDLWTEKTRMPDELDSLYTGQGFSAVVDNKIMVLYSHFTSFSSPTKNRIVTYDPIADTWSEKDGYPSAYGANGGGVGVSTGRFAPQKVYAFWARNAFVYEPIHNTWSATKTLPTVRWGFGVAVVDDILYVIGGYTYIYPDVLGSPSEPCSVNEQYVPFGYSSTPLTSEPSITVTPTSSDSFIFSEPEPSETAKSFLNNPVTVVTIVLIIGTIVTTSLFFYMQKIRKETKYGKCNL
ncbi:MAG: hypothetical protein FWD52_08785 [Candidatus Bathyarchaeota archaeon]|nr:hypothetical protein [Candidatus Termiticorpusculum sp.]